MQEAPSSNSSLVVYVLPFIVPAITALVLLVKKQGMFDTKGSLTEYNVTTIRNDLTEVKSDVKELRKDQQELNTTINEMKMISDRVKRVEDTLDDQEKRLWPQVTGALRSIDILTVRVDNLEDQLKIVRRKYKYDALGQLEDTKQ